jgi:predicted nucleic acid-binding protein
MRHILLDTNVILDLFLEREPFVDSAALLWAAHESGYLTAYVSAITPVNLFYIARKFKGREVAIQAVAELLATLPICTVDDVVLQAGLRAGFKDFEDAVQYASALSSRLDAIITRNSADYSAASLPVYSPMEYIEKFPLGLGDN